MLVGKDAYLLLLVRSKSAPTMLPRREGVLRRSFSFPSFILLDCPVNFFHILDVDFDPMLLFATMEEDDIPLGGVGGATGLELDDDGVTRSAGLELEEEEEKDLLTISGTVLRSGVGDRVGSGSNSESATGSSLIDGSVGIFVEDLL
jgi:hypothetical protein